MGREAAGSNNRRTGCQDNGVTMVMAVPDFGGELHTGLDD